MVKLKLKHHINSSFKVKTVVKEDSTQTTLPRVLEPFESSRKNQDVRMSLAYALFEEVSRGNVLLMGTPRSGRTTSVIAESCNRAESVLVIEPLIRIAKETVRDALTQADLTETARKIIHIPSNRACKKIAAEIEVYPLLKELPILPLPELCYECNEYDECEYTEICRVTDSEIDVMTLTSHKLIALMLSPNSVSTEILKKIGRVSKNIVFDECHKLEREEVKRVTLSEHTTKGDFNHKFDQYESLRNEYKSITKVVDTFKEIVFREEIKKATEEVLSQAVTQNRVFEKHLRRLFPNDYGNVFERRGLVSGTHYEIIKLTKTLTYKEINFGDVLKIYDMLAVVTSDRIAISAINRKGKIEVQIVAADHMHRELIIKFFDEMASKKRIILTSGSIGSFDYGQLFTGKVNKVLWGRGGDPKKANSKMLILADHKTYTNKGKSSFRMNMEEIVESIVKIKREFNKVKIFTMNAELAGEIEKALQDEWIYLEKNDIDYYNSKSSMGVESDYRVMITVGLAHKPTNTYDAVTEDQEASYIMYQESMQADTWQAINRVKDPEGKKPSIVFMLGTNAELCKKVSAWGINRIIKVDTYSKRIKSEVLCRCQKMEQIASPEIKKCKSVDEMISIAKIHCLSKN